MKRTLLRIGFAMAAGAIAWACSSTRHVPAGEQLLEEVNIRVDDSSGVDRAEFINYVRQQPNHKVLGFAKLQLGLYNMSGRDSTKWYNRWLQRLGQAPVVYDDALTQASELQLRQALINKGYMNAQGSKRHRRQGKALQTARRSRPPICPPYSSPGWFLRQAR